jgi:hypothetical protein
MKLRIAALVKELSVDFAPLTQSNEGEERISASFFKARSSKLFSEGLVEVPYSQQAEEIAIWVTELLMCVVGVLLKFRWSHAWVLSFKCGCDDEGFIQAALIGSGEEQATDARRNRPSSKDSAYRCKV